jgi:predicted ATP-grasp superfamily ATP-dependent carboligase
MGKDLIILGASARAAAQSAMRAGYDPWCIDLFADRDLQAVAPVVRCPADRYPIGVLSLLETAPMAPVLYTGAMENYPEVLDAIALRRPLKGCAPAAVRAVREPYALASMPAHEGIKSCKVLGSASLLTRAGGAFRALFGNRRKFLVKPRRGAGGAGIRQWSPPEAVPTDCYLQEFIAGTPMSAIFHADGWSARLLGATEQFIGEPEFGGSGFHYCGGIGPAPLSADARRGLMGLGVVLAQRFDLRGVFGVDMVMDFRGTLRPVEVNPRYTAGVELLERATGLATLADHPAEAPDAGRCALHAKAILFAKKDCVVPDLYAIHPRDAIADVPMAGEKVPAGRPICTLFATGASRDACLVRLRQEAKKLYTQLDTRTAS